MPSHPGRRQQSCSSTASRRQVIDHLTRLAPLERLGQPQDVANTVAFLAGPDGGWINGQVLRANGGII